MGKIVFLLSLVLQIIVSYIFPSTKMLTTYFLPLFFLVALVIGYPYFRKKEEYFISSFLIGLWFDLGTYGTVFLEGVLLLCIAYCIHKTWKYCSFHLGNILLLLLLSILLYEGMHFFLLCFFTSETVTFYSLCTKILHSLLLNVCYAFLVYFVVYKKRRYL